MLNALDAIYVPIGQGPSRFTDDDFEDAESMEPSPSPHLKEGDHRRTFWQSPRPAAEAPIPLTFAEVVARGTLTMADVA